MPETFAALHCRHEAVAVGRRLAAGRPPPSDGPTYGGIARLLL